MRLFEWVPLLRGAWEPLLRTAPQSGVQPVAPWLDRLLSAPLAMEAAFLGAGKNLPTGQSLLLIAELIDQFERHWRATLSRLQ